VELHNGSTGNVSGSATLIFICCSPSVECLFSSACIVGGQGQTVKFYGQENSHYLLCIGMKIEDVVGICTDSCRNGAV